MKASLIIYCLFLLLPIVGGQNIVPNQGFEYCRIPINDWMLTDAQFNECMINWYSPNSGSPDILQRNEVSRMRHVRPDVNIQSYSPRNENVMVGLKLFGCEDGDHCKEYIQIRLREGLQIGQQYHLSVWTNTITLQFVSTTRRLERTREHR